MKKFIVFSAIMMFFVSTNKSDSASILNGVVSDGTNEQQKINRLKEDINSSSPEVRSTAAKEIISLYYNKKIKIDQAVPGLIKELESINWNSLSSEEGEYSGELISILGDYKDSRAIPAIMNSLGHTGGGLVVEALAKLGPAVLDPLIEKLNDEKYNTRTAALFYLGRVPVKLKEYGSSLSEENRDKIRIALKRGLADEDESTRKQAITAIRDVHGLYSKTELEDIVNQLEAIAGKDPYKMRQTANGKEKEIYPVRDEASKVLAILKKK